MLVKAVRARRVAAVEACLREGGLRPVRVVAEEAKGVLMLWPCGCLGFAIWCASEGLDLLALAPTRSTCRQLPAMRLMLTNGT